MNFAKCQRLLDVICPMHVVFDNTGIINSAGPTAQKIARAPLVGSNLLDVYRIKRPREINTIEELCRHSGERLKLSFRTEPETQLQGVLMEGPGEQDWIFNMSFGISVVDAVHDFNLTASDFAITDLTVEMLYLVEAKSAAMEASRQLNERLRIAREEAEHKALTDTLTGLKNRRALDQEIAAALNSDEPFALLHIDLDFFKTVNDTLGHAAGDHVLVEVSQIMREETRDTDVISRIGGDEFVILVKGTDDREVIDQIGGRIVDRLSEPIPFEGTLCCVSGSIGTAISADYTSPTADILLSDADIALYAAKHAGRGRHVFFEPHMRKEAHPTLSKAAR